MVESLQMQTSLEKITRSIPIPNTKIAGIQLSNILHTDAMRILSYCQNPLITDTTLIPVPYSTRDLEDYYDNLAQIYAMSSTCLLWAIRDTNIPDKFGIGRYIGSVGLHPPKHQNEMWKNNSLAAHSQFHVLGYYIDPNYWGKSIMSNAVQVLLNDIAKKELKLQRVRSEAFDGNMASHAVLKKAGFVNAGHVKDKYEKQGKKISSTHYELVYS